ncbi:hypothetical protein P7K49_015005, partial [Saguinus oedipus]
MHLVSMASVWQRASGIEEAPAPPPSAIDPQPVPSTPQVPSTHNTGLPLLPKQIQTAPQYRMKR